VNEFSIQKIIYSRVKPGFSYPKFCVYVCYSAESVAWFYFEFSADASFVHQWLNTIKSYSNLHSTCVDTIDLNKRILLSVVSFLFARQMKPYFLPIFLHIKSTWSSSFSGSFSIIPRYFILITRSIGWSLIFSETSFLTIRYDHKLRFFNIKIKFFVIQPFRQKL
jgi:hypothetical protein